MRSKHDKVAKATIENKSQSIHAERQLSPCVTSLPFLQSAAEGMQVFVSLQYEHPFWATPAEEQNHIFQQEKARTKGS